MSKQSYQSSSSTKGQTSNKKQICNLIARHFKKYHKKQVQQNSNIKQFVKTKTIKNMYILKKDSVAKQILMQYITSFEILQDVQQQTIKADCLLLLKKLYIFFL